MQDPRLRTVEKYKPPFPLNKFPSDFALKLAREIVYILVTRETTDIEGSDWERVFSQLIGARWKPSNVGLDDVVLEQTAWGAKSVKHDNPASATRIRLISGRNSPVFSYGDTNVVNREPNELGEKVLSIYNERVAGIKRDYKHLRTVVLIKSDDLLELACFELNTQQYLPEDYVWEWNKNKNLLGFIKKTHEHKFTWQPHGSQFTIIENVPPDRFAIRIRQPESLSKDSVLETLGFDETWFEVIKETPAELKL